MLSIIYILTAVSAISFLLLINKNEDTQELIIWIPICYIAYECFIVLVASILTILHIPANLITLGIANTIISLIGGIWIKKTGNIQKYYINIGNMLFFIILSITVIFFGFERYGKDFQLCFETSDPGTHLKLAMDTVNNQSVITSLSTALFVNPFTNGIFIRVMLPVFKGVDVYKSFIIKEIINWGLSGLVFYSYIYKNLKTFWLKLFGMGITIFFIFGYPYSNLLFGFSYLGFTVTLITYLMFITDVYLDSKKNNCILLMLMSLGCLGVAEGYTLFAPFVFIGVFICIAYKNKCEYGSLIHSIQFYVCELKVFLIPTILTILFTIVYPHFVVGSELTLNGAYDTVLKMEGAIYRNLYSDFIICMPFVFYTIYTQFRKNKKYTINTFIFLSLTIYLVLGFISMYYEKISSYYYYKLNYVVWMLIFTLFVEGIYHICKTAKEFAAFYCGCWGMIFTLWFTNWDLNLYKRNAMFNPSPQSTNYFTIYNTNRVTQEQKRIVSSELIQLCKEIDAQYKGDDQLVMYLGYWLNTYWYEALTNQRQGFYSIHDPVGFTQNFVDGMYGDYLVVAKGEESLDECYPLIQNCEILYENKHGIIIRRNANGYSEKTE